MKGLRIAFSPDLGMKVEVEPEVADLVSAAARRFEDLGASVEPIELSLPDPTHAFRIAWYAGGGRIWNALSDGQQSLIDPGLQEVAREGASYSLKEYFEAQSQREAYTVAVARLYRNYDLLLTPTLPLVAFDAGLEKPVDADLGAGATGRPLRPFNLTAAGGSVPAGSPRPAFPQGCRLSARATPTLWYCEPPGL